MNFDKQVSRLLEEFEQSLAGIEQPTRGTTSSTILQFFTSALTEMGRSDLSVEDVGITEVGFELSISSEEEDFGVAFVLSGPDKGIAIVAPADGGDPVPIGISHLYPTKELDELDWVDADLLDHIISAGLSKGKVVKTPVVTIGPSEPL